VSPSATTSAAVDIGSNAARLLVRRDGATVIRRSEITRLAEGLGRTGRLQADALERTADALRAYRLLIDEHGASMVRVVATAAARTAGNVEELLTIAEAALGHAPEVLSAAAEARLSFAGVMAGGAIGRVGGHEDGGGPAQLLVVDIGGGSTELVIGTGSPTGREAPSGLASLALGSATLTEAQLPSDPPRPEELSNAIAIAQDHLDDALRTLGDLDDAVTIVGLGGTITTVAAVELGLPVPGGEAGPAGTRDVADAALHGFFLTRAAAEDVFRTLSGEPWRDRVHNPGLPRQRASLIVGGCCILVGLLRRLRAPGLVVSVTDLLDGLLDGSAASGP